VPQFVVILRQAFFFALVMDEKSPSLLSMPVFVRSAHKRARPFWPPFGRTPIGKNSPALSDGKLWHYRDYFKLWHYPQSLAARHMEIRLPKKACQDMFSYCVNFSV
jgi:hypothetical protein